MGKLYERVLLQREAAMDAAAEAVDDGKRPPEVRMGKISANGRVRLEFTNPM